MRIKITSQEQNPLLKRTDITFEVEHKETRGTPSRLEVRKELASKLKRNTELVYVKKMETRTGTMTATGKATAYDSVEQAKLVEPEHIIIRNTPPEKPEEEKAEKVEEKVEKKEAEKEGKPEEKAKEAEENERQKAEHEVDEKGAKTSG